jgi:hypothetical protein
MVLIVCDGRGTTISTVSILSNDSYALNQPTSKKSASLVSTTVDLRIAPAPSCAAKSSVNRTFALFIVESITWNLTPVSVTWPEPLTTSKPFSTLAIVYVPLLATLPSKILSDFPTSSDVKGTALPKVNPVTVAVIAPSLSSFRTASSRITV